jgi:hypothetical protein
MFSLALAACGPGSEDSGPDLGADTDGDGFTDGEELAAGSDLDDSDDVPYTGGWAKDADCRHDVVSSGNEEGQIAEDFALLDQYGDEFHLHDFCNRVLLIEFAGFT